MIRRMIPRLIRRSIASIALLAGAVVPSVQANTFVPVFASQWGAPGTGAGTFQLPSMLVVDANGFVYVVDSNLHLVEKFDHNGNYVAQWGGNGSGNGQFVNPEGIALSLDNHLYVADTGNHRIQVFALDGTWLFSFGTQGSGNGQFSFPTGLAIDAANQLYVVDTGNDRVQRFSAGGAYLGGWGSTGSGNGQFANPRGIALDAVGNVFVTDYLNNRVQRFHTDGSYVGQWGLQGGVSWAFSNPFGIAVDASGVVLVGDLGHHTIARFTATGQFLNTLGSQGSSPGQFQFPRGMAFDSAGRLYVADGNNRRIQTFLPSLNNNYFAAGSWGGVGTGNGQFNSAFKLAVDLSSMFVVDQNNNRIQRFRLDGSYLSQWGSTGSGTGQFNQPTGIATDRLGRVYVADLGNARIQMFNGSGLFLGSFGSSGTGPGQLMWPVGIAVDAAGNIFVVDNFLDRVQKFSSAGAFQLQWGTHGTGPGQFDHAVGIAIDSEQNVYVTDFNGRHVQKFTNNGAFVAQWGGAGTAAQGLFGAPTGLTIDADDNVWVADAGNGAVQVFSKTGLFLRSIPDGRVWPVGGQPSDVAIDSYGSLYVVSPVYNQITRVAMPARIKRVVDVGNDQGRQVRIEIARASLDAFYSQVPITQYEVYRQVAPGALTASAGAAPAPDGAQLAGWEQVAVIAAHGESAYDIVAPSLRDATTNASGLSTYLVRAATANPYTYFDSVSEQGYSLDNLSPPSPSPFTAAYVAGSTQMQWGASTASDFASFRLYRGDSGTFPADDAHVIAVTTGTSYADPGPLGRWYKLTAVDFAGNESPVAVVSPSTTLNAPASGAPRALELAVGPNPLSLQGVVSLGLPAEGNLRVAVYDAAGRQVRDLAHGSRAAGWHSLRWNADDSGGRQVPNGVYFVRADANHESRVVRVVIAR